MPIHFIKHTPKGSFKENTYCVATYCANDDNNWEESSFYWNGHQSDQELIIMLRDKGLTELNKTHSTSVNDTKNPRDIRCISITHSSQEQAIQNIKCIQKQLTAAQEKKGVMFTVDGMHIGISEQHNEDDNGKQYILSFNPAGDHSDESLAEKISSLLEQTNKAKSFSGLTSGPPPRQVATTSQRAIFELFRILNPRHKLEQAQRKKSDPKLFKPNPPPEDDGWFSSCTIL